MVYLFQKKGKEKERKTPKAKPLTKNLLDLPPRLLYNTSTSRDNERRKEHGKQSQERQG